MNLLNQKQSTAQPSEKEKKMTQSNGTIAIGQLVKTLFPLVSNGDEQKNKSDMEVLVLEMVRNHIKETFDVIDGWLNKGISESNLKKMINLSKYQTTLDELLDILDFFIGLFCPSDHVGKLYSKAWDFLKFQCRSNLLVYPNAIKMSSNVFKDYRELIKFIDMHCQYLPINYNVADVEQFLIQSMTKIESFSPLFKSIQTMRNRNDEQERAAKDLIKKLDQVKSQVTELEQLTEGLQKKLEQPLFKYDSKTQLDEFLVEASQWIIKQTGNTHLCVISCNKDLSALFQGSIDKKTKRMNNYPY